MFGKDERFNSRTREGCDVSQTSPSRSASRFNSRTREGCDAYTVSKYDLVSNVSIHAPGRGATGSARCRLTGTICFNSRTREGCDWLRQTASIQD